MTPSAGPTPPSSGDAGLDGLIDAYLDGALTPEQRLQVEAQARTNEALARELSLQQRAEDSIRRQFQPPVMPALPTTTTSAGRALEAAPARRLLFRPAFPLGVYAAAAAVLGMAISMAIYQFVLSARPVGPLYHKVVDAGFKPQWVCENDEQFTQYTRERFGTPWTFDKDPSITLVGWRYSEDVLSPDESVLLATKGGEKIVVVADEASHDRKLRDSGGLHVYRRELGKLVLYEISPLDKPEVIGRIAMDEPGTK